MRLGLRVVVSVAGAFVALAALAGFHHLAQLEGADQWERAAFLVWSGQCQRAEVLCKSTALEYLESHK